MKIGETKFIKTNQQLIITNKMNYTQQQLNQLSIKKYNKLYNQLTLIEKKHLIK